MFKSAYGVIAALNERLVRPRPKSRRRRGAPPRAFAGAIESLEDRRLLAVITVTSLLDTVEDGDEVLTLREAILIANDSTGATSFEGISSTDVADTIVFDLGTFDPVIFLTQGQLPTVTEELRIDGTWFYSVSTGRVIIDAQNESRVFENDSNLTLENLVLRNGFTAFNGGAILNQSGAVLSLDNVEIAQSTALCCGGGLYNLGQAAITNSTFVGNTADFGGGMENDGVATISGSTFSGNVAHSSGGALYNFGVGDSESFVAGTLTIIDTTISGNTAVDGGGLRNDGAATITGGILSENTASNGGGGINNFGFSDPETGVLIGGTLTIDGTTLSGNTALNGGGLLNFSQATIAGSTLTGNTAQGDGGGIANDEIGTLVLDTTQFLNNAAALEGGGLANAGTATITGGTFSGNLASVSGGGIANKSGGTVTITGTTISGNTALNGGGLFSDVGGTATITSAVLDGNSASVGAGFQNVGTATITGSAITNNTATLDGGGVHNSGDLTIDASAGAVQISQNFAHAHSFGRGGGGIFNSGTLVIEGAQLLSNNGFASGGGILNDQGVLTVIGSILQGNRSTEGGGLHNASTATLTASTITENQAYFGGGVSNGRTATLVLDQTVISSNVAFVSGGGIHNRNDLAVTGGMFEGNEAPHSAGAIFNDGDAAIIGANIQGNSTDVDGGGIWNLGHLTIAHSTISGNTAGSNGGGLFNSGDVWNGRTATLVLDQTVVASNTALADGGGIANFNDLTVTGGVFAGNQAASGGALFNSGDATITGATIRDNTADLDGGGIHTLGTLTITDGTVSGNQASLSGGGIRVGSGTATLTRVSITGNTALGEHGGGLSSSATLVIADSTIDANDADEEGGGIFVESGTATLANVSISGNTAGQAGGGLSNWFGAVAITDSTIADNTADGPGGGIFSGLLSGILDSETGSITGTLSIERSIVSSNTAEAGGGVYNIGAATITSSTVSGNTAAVGSGVDPNGGGINNVGQLTITDSSVADNTADGRGGGLFNAAGATASLAFVSVTGNSSGQEGGGIANFGDATISSSTISGNIAEGSGGGIRNASFGSESGTATFVIENSTISGNTALNGGGISAGGGTVALLSVTVASNVASGNGGGVHIGSGAVTATSTLIASNAASAGRDVGGSLTDLGFNLIGNTAGMAFATGQAVSTLVNVDPRLGPLQDNGGPTLTHALLPGSPAIDKGANPTEALFDQRGPGFDRTVGGRTDIGAFEVQSLPAPGTIVVGSGLGAAPEIRIYDPQTNQLIASFAPFPSFFRGGIRVATGDVNGDGVADIVASAAPKGPPRVRVFDGTDLTGGTVLMDFFAYHAGFGGGVFVATGDVNNDGRADIITGAGAGGGPIVKVFSGADPTGGTVLMSFFAYDPSFRGGVQVAAGDLNGDNRDDVITGAGPGGGPHVKVFSGADLTGGTALMSFFPYHRSFSGGVHVAGGDLNGDGRDDVITGAGFGGGPHVRAFSGADPSAATLLADFFAYERSFRGGVRVAGGDVNGDGIDDIITGAGPLAGPLVRAFNGPTGAELESFFAASPSSTGGVYVSGVTRRTAEPLPVSVPSSTSGGSGLTAGSFQLDDLFSDTLVLEELQSL